MSGLVTVEDFVRTALRRGSRGGTPPSAAGLYGMLVDDLDEIERRQRQRQSLSDGERWLLRLAREEMPEGAAP